MISDFPLFRPASRALYKRLDRLAASGDFDINLLDQLRLLPETQKSRFTVYYLASLYLQLGDESTARDMLSSTVGWSPAIKKFYCVLSFCRQSLLPVPKLNAAEGIAQIISIQQSIHRVQPLSKNFQLPVVFPLLAMRRVLL